MSAGSVRAGKVFVEIGADPKAFFRALNQVNKSIASMGQGLMSGGGKLMAMGAGMAAPIVAAVRQGVAFESTLLNIRASTNATAGEIDKIKTSAMDMSQALGVGPTEAAQGMLELLKAGVPLETVLNGAGRAALEFSKVAGLDGAVAATVMSKAMNAFGVDATTAANSMSAAADASATSVEEMAQAFSQASAVASTSNQGINDLSAALAVLANKGIVGSDAGTSIKTMLQKLKVPTNDAASALAKVGLTFASFRGADGQLLPLVDIIKTLEKAIGGVDQATKDDVLGNVFGSDAIRAASILTAVGSSGFNDMKAAMDSALPVGEKFQILMSGLAGAGSRILAGLQRLSIVIAGAVGPALAEIVPFITGAIDGFTKFAQNNREAVVGFAKLAVGAIAVGGAMTGLGLSLRLTAVGLGGVGQAVALLLSPLSLVSRNVTLVGKSFVLAMPHTIKLAKTIGASMLASSAAVLSFAATAGTAMAGFAASSIAGVTRLASVAVAGFGQLASSAMSAAQSMFPVFFTGFNRGIAAGAGFFSATLRGLNGVVMASGTLRAALFAVSGSSIGRFVKDIAGGLTFTYKAFAWWAAGVSARLAQYAVNAYAAAAKSVTSAAQIAAAWVTSAAAGIAAFAASATGGLSTYVVSAVSAAAASVANAVRTGAAWVASALPGVIAFVSSAVAGLATYLGAAAAAVAGSAVSAAAVAAAWMAPLAPFALMAAAIAGAGALAYKFKDQIGAALGGVSAMAGQAGSAITGTLSVALSDAMVVFGDLFATASTTFTGIYDAIVAGDLSSAMDILWAGLQAGWLRGVEALMSYVDPWIASFQDAFTIMGAEIYKGFDALWTSVAGVLNTAGAVLMGAMDNIINGILASWDFLEASIRKAWIRVSGIFKDGETKQAELDAVDADMKGRAAEREKNRPGVSGRMEKAAKENTAAEAAMLARRDAIDAGTQDTIAGREDANQRRAEERRQGVMAAEARLAGLSADAATTRQDVGSVSGISEALTAVESLSDLGSIGEQISGLLDRDKLTAEQEQRLMDEYNAAAVRLNQEATSTGDQAAQAAAGAGAAGDQSRQSMGAVAGTFSSLNLGAQFGGTTVQERIARAAEETAKNTRDMGSDKVAA